MTFFYGSLAVMIGGSLMSFMGYAHTRDKLEGTGSVIMMVGMAGILVSAWLEGI